MSALDAPLELRLPAPITRKLAKGGIDTVEDLLLNAPKRFYHWGALTPMSLLREGEDVTILAQVESAALVANKSRPGVRLEVRLTDGHSKMSATFFAKSEYKLAPHVRLLTPGESFLFAGKVGSYRGKLSLVNPSFEGMDGDEDLARERTLRPIPIYAQSQGLTSWVVARAIGMLLDTLTCADVPDVLPKSVREQWKVPHRFEVLQMLHRPLDDDQARAARTALALEEAFVLQTVLALRRVGAQSLSAPSCPRSDEVDAFIEGLPFQMTDAQHNALTQILSDMESTHPMQRLLQGDVGSGKTVVALAAFVAVLAAGHQGALVAPTEVLAAQHLATMRALAEHLHIGGEAIDIRLLTASTPPAARREITMLMESGRPLIVVGTHALLQDTVTFADLGLVVIDEQHRFGVAQRDRLRSQDEGRAAHQLVMTATPIPRTVAMTVFGDLAETRMEGLPPGRTTVSTFLVDRDNATWMQRLWQRASEEISRGGRVYVVCPRIDDSDDLPDADPAELGTPRPPLASVASVAQQLRTIGVFHPSMVAQLTGRTKNEEKAEVMRAFSAGETPILVATTVVEVGVDVPEASMMVILDAQQFGISQLHQLRGRVGRSARPSICMAVHRHDLGAGTMERLEAFASTTNGFELAEKDLELRREGDVLGAQQSGRGTHLRFLSVRRDARLIAKARAAAAAIVESDQTLSAYPALAAHLRRSGQMQLEWISRS